MNPNLVWQGDSGRRQAILLEYRREGGADIKPLRRQTPKEVTKSELMMRLKALDLEMESLKAQLFGRTDSHTG